MRLTGTSAPRSRGAIRSGRNSKTLRQPNPTEHEDEHEHGDDFDAPYERGRTTYSPREPNASGKYSAVSSASRKRSCH